MKKLKEFGWFEWLAIIIMVVSGILFIYNFIDAFG